MDLEEIESSYSLETTQANAFFLQGLKDKLNKKNLEKKFKDKLNKARDRYYSRIKKYLSDHKYKKPQKKEKIEKKEKKTIYDYRKNFKDKLVYNLKILKFKIKITSRQIRDNNNISTINFKLKQLKVRIKHLYMEFRNKVKYHYSEISEKTVKEFVKIKDNTKRNFEKIKEYIISKLQKIKDFFKKNKIKEKARGKTSRRSS